MGAKHFSVDVTLHLKEGVKKFENIIPFSLALKDSHAFVVLVIVETRIISNVIFEDVIAEISYCSVVWLKR